MVLRISHQTPSTAHGCASVAAAGAQVFEIDLRAIGGQIYVTHFLPVLPGVPWVERDGWSFQRRPHEVTAESMTEVVARLPADSKVLLDLKDDRGTGAARLVDLILQSDVEPGRVYVSSKNWASMVPLAQAGFRTWRTVDTGLSLRRLLTRDDPAAHDGVTVRHQLLNVRTLAAIRERSPKVIAWTVNRESRARYLVAQGVDGITSDSPRVLSALQHDAAAETPDPAG